MAVLNAVVDLSHHNDVPDFTPVKRAGIIGVIHKATQGFRFADPMYAPHRQAAQRAGLLWGAYHFGVGGDGIAQADFFLSVVEPGPADLVVLDLEANTQGSTMSVHEAAEFVAHVHDATGRWPGLYSGSAFLRDALRQQPEPTLANCWLWLAQYAPRTIVPPNWSTWTLWQYTDGGSGDEPHTVDGIGRCDRDRFNGDEAALRAFWNTSVGVSPSTPAPDAATAPVPGGAGLPPAFMPPLSATQIDRLFDSNTAELNKMDVAAGSVVSQLISELERKGRATYIYLRNAAVRGHTIEYTFIQGNRALIGQITTALGFKSATDTSLEVRGA